MRWPPLRLLRPLAWALALAGVLGAALAGQGPAVEVAAGQAAAAQLDELAELSGLRAPGQAPLAVELARPKEAPAWAASALAQAVASSPEFERRTPAQGALVLEIVGTERAFAVAVSLWRQGWALRTGAPTRARVELTWLGALLLLGVALARRSGALALVSLALALQGLAAFAPWPDPPGAPVLGQAMVEGPWGRSLRGFLADRGPARVALLAGVAAGAGLLAWFDHRRSLRQGRALPPARALLLLALVLAALLAMEAALRLGLGAWLRSGWGALALLAASLPLLAARLSHTALRTP